MNRFGADFQPGFGGNGPSELQRELLEIIGREGKTFSQIRRTEYLQCNGNRAATTIAALSMLMQFGMIDLVDGRFGLTSPKTNFEAA